jgi:hypothetical protein
MLKMMPFYVKIPFIEVEKDRKREKIAIFAFKLREISTWK